MRVKRKPLNTGELERKQKKKRRKISNLDNFLGGKDLNQKIASLAREKGNKHNESRKVSARILMILFVELMVLNKLEECWLHLQIHYIGECWPCNGVEV